MGSERRIQKVGGGDKGIKGGGEADAERLDGD